MALMDYGSIVKKNGKIIQTNFFMDMKESMGFTIDEPIKYEYKFRKYKYDDDFEIVGYEDKCEEATIRKPNGNYFSYMGDSELLVMTYRGILYVVSNGEVKKIVYDLRKEDSLHYRVHKLEFNINGVDFRIKRLFDMHRYLVRFSYKGDLYECIYGYGVDVDKDAWYGVSNRERRYVDKWFKN